MNKKPLILLTNDDGVKAHGLFSLIEAVQALGEVVVVAPDGPRSAQSSALTVTQPLRIKKNMQSDSLSVYQCTGTPADCVKMALHQVLDRLPDLLVSGINHGSNASISVLYSGTLGAALEGCVAGIPSIGFSLCSFDPQADFTHAVHYARLISQQALQHPLPQQICLNVNIPVSEQINGVKICRQAKGYWKEEFLRRQDPMGRNYYWLSGEYVNAEAESRETDEWALANNYVSVVPVKIDMTAYEYMTELKQWEL